MALPITILLPTRNSMELLPAHVEAMTPLLPLADSVIHVDSESKDGTVEYIRTHVRHQNFQYFDRPPGLYQSWNFGIQQAQSKYIYVSTVGDTLTPDGLQRLHQVSEELKSDVLVSVPRFLHTNGSPANVEWPAHRMVRELQIREPKLIPPALVFSYAIRMMPEGILNSSASNLYRTEMLRARPFPTEFGTVGDTAWGLRHACEIRFGILPESFSTFLLHEKSYSLPQPTLENLRECFIALAFEMAKGINPRPGDLSSEKLGLYFDTWKDLQAAQNSLYLYRKRFSIGWLFVPAAWRTRALRNRIRKEAELHFAELTEIAAAFFNSQRL